MKRNEGFSLIEFVIVMAIMAILTGLVALGMGVFDQAEVKDVSESINSAFSELKTENMSKTGPIYMHMFIFEGNYYVEMGPVSTCSMSGDYGTNIGAVKDSKIALDGNELADGDVWTFNISKKDGSFNSLSSTPLDSASPTISVSTPSDSLTYDVVLVRDTGRHYIDK